MKCVNSRQHQSPTSLTAFPFSKTSINFLENPLGVVNREYRVHGNKLFIANSLIMPAFISSLELGYPLIRFNDRNSQAMELLPNMIVYHPFSRFFITHYRVDPLTFGLSDYMSNIEIYSQNVTPDLTDIRNYQSNQPFKVGLLTRTACNPLSTVVVAVPVPMNAKVCSVGFGISEAAVANPIVAVNYEMLPQQFTELIDSKTLAIPFDSLHINFEVYGMSMVIITLAIGESTGKYQYGVEFQ